MARYATILHTEEGMRDGLRIENPDIPVSDKIRLLNALSETGLTEIATFLPKSEMDAADGVHRRHRKRFHSQAGCPLHLLGL